MKAVDSSVVIAAFATWHEYHAIARKAMASRPRIICSASLTMRSTSSLQVGMSLIRPMQVPAD